MIKLSKKWCEFLVQQPETGMGYQVVSVDLYDGRRFDDVIVDSGYITQIRGINDVPFEDAQIKNITVTHAKWHFGKQ